MQHRFLQNQNPGAYRLRFRPGRFRYGRAFHSGFGRPFYGGFGRPCGYGGPFLGGGVGGLVGSTLVGHPYYYPPYYGYPPYYYPYY